MTERCGRAFAERDSNAPRSCVLERGHEGPCESATTLADTGCVYVTLRAAREYARRAGDTIILGEETARRELTELLLKARRQPDRGGTYERWRYRSRARGVDVSALVSREGPLAVVVTVEVRG